MMYIHPARVPSIVRVRVTFPEESKISIVLPMLYVAIWKNPNPAAKAKICLETFRNGRLTGTSTDE
jgi:hypothetical protein